MNFGARFSEFGMTGAVFWIFQILLFTVGTGEIEGQQLLSMLGDFIGSNENSSSVLQNAAGSLLTVFGLIGIFVTGLILDMMGSIFFMQEMRIFGKHISSNLDWLNNMTSKCSAVIVSDYQDFKQEFDDSAVAAKTKASRLFDPRFHYRRYALRFHYRRLQTYLLSYIHVYSANGASDQLMDHVHVWRTARAISMALFIVAIEVLLFEQLFPMASHTSGTIELIHNGSQQSAQIIHWALFGISAMLTLKSYNRMCYSLFTLACATNSHQPSTK